MHRSKKSDDDDDDFYAEQENIPLSDSQRQQKIRKEHVLEAEVQENDTLISLALRFNCTVSDIKRLNGIHNNNEVAAFKTIKIPLSAHNVLIDALPKVHKSGSNSPRTAAAAAAIAVATTSINSSSDVITSKEKLEEKLLVASVSSAVILKSNGSAVSEDEVMADETGDVAMNEPLLRRSQFRALRPPRNDFMTFNGSDCELNWIFLLVAILLVCFIVPLIYVYLVYEHPEKFNHTHSRYDDPELHYRAHFNDHKLNVSTNIHS